MPRAAPQPRGTFPWVSSTRAGKPSERVWENPEADARDSGNPVAVVCHLSRGGLEKRGQRGDREELSSWRGVRSAAFHVDSSPRCCGFFAGLFHSFCRCYSEILSVPVFWSSKTQQPHTLPHRAWSWLGVSVTPWPPPPMALRFWMRSTKLGAGRWSGVNLSQTVNPQGFSRSPKRGLAQACGATRELLIPWVVWTVSGIKLRWHCLQAGSPLQSALWPLAEGGVRLFAGRSHPPCKVLITLRVY